ncbi:hypothetical protein PHYBOEH_003369, partial [Phytophthora boehmeriae]
MQLPTPGTPVEKQCSFVYPNKLERGERVDHNGITVGHWSTGLFNCFDSCIPNGFMAFLCPVISVAQISVRLGLARYAFLTCMHVALYLLGIVAAVSASPALLCLCVAAEVLTTMGVIHLRFQIRRLFSIPGNFAKDAAVVIACRPCTIAQMATHVEAYQPGQCMFRARSTLPG